MRTVIVTGGLGFIGSHLIKELLRSDPDTHIVNVDSRTYAAVDGRRFSSWPEVHHSTQLGMSRARFNERHLWLGADVSDAITMARIFDRYDPDAVIHLAAESHVDRAIDNADPFMKTNLMGTQVLLDACVRHAHGVDFVYVSTDEVYGPLHHAAGSAAAFSEDDRLSPGNPYAATKAGAEHLVMAYGNTYDLDVRITRGCNTYGTYQHPEKFLPLFILNAMEGKPLPIYGDGLQAREWLHVKDHAAAILFALNEPGSGEVYNITSGESYFNIEIARVICDMTGQSRKLIQHVKDRPGHDRAYRVSTRLEGFWEPKQLPFLTPSQDDPCGLSEIIKWYTGREGQQWCTDAGMEARDRCGTRTREE